MLPVATAFLRLIGFADTSTICARPSVPTCVRRFTLAANRYHPAVGLIILAEIVSLWLSINNVQQKLLELSITRSGTQWFHDIELQIAPQAWTHFSVTRESKFVAVFTEMKIGHRPDEADTLRPSRNLIVSGRTIRPKLNLTNQTAIVGFDFLLCLVTRHEVFIVEHLRGAHRHQLDESKNQITCGRKFYKRN